MTLQWTIVGMTTAALACASTAALATPCSPARATPRVTFQPDPWRIAAEALLNASAKPGLPWSCTGGVIDLVAHDEGGATLTVVDDDGRSISREVASPDDVEPLGEALLSKPELPPPPLPTPPPPAQNVNPDLGVTSTPSEDHATPIATPATPRALLSAVVAPRYAGQSNLIWAGVTGAVTLPFSGAWSGGAWARYDGPSASLGPRASSLNELCFGLSAGHTFALRPIEIVASVKPSVAVVTRSEGALPATRIDGRLGVEARGVLPLTTSLRAVLAIDAELAPREMGAQAEDDPIHRGMYMSYFPTYTVGLGLGMEVAVR